MIFWAVAVINTFVGEEWEIGSADAQEAAVEEAVAVTVVGAGFYRDR